MTSLKTKRLLAASLATILIGGGWAAASMAGSHGQPMQGMDQGQMMEGMGNGQMGGMKQGQAAPMTDATQGFMAAMAQMQTAMAMEYSGDANVDFARGMIPHHQGAIAMAKVMLEHGDAPELRELAEGIIAAQEKEIAFLQGWLAENGN